MEASREFSRTPPRLPPCSDVSVFQKTRMSHFWDTHHIMHTRAFVSMCTNVRLIIVANRARPAYPAGAGRRTRLVPVWPPGLAAHHAHAAAYPRSHNYPHWQLEQAHCDHVHDKKHKRPTPPPPHQATRSHAVAPPQRQPHVPALVSPGQTYHRQCRSGAWYCQRPRQKRTGAPATNAPSQRRLGRLERLDGALLTGRGLSSERYAKLEVGPHHTPCRR